MKTNARVIWLGIIFALVYLSFQLVRPVIIDIISGAILAYVFFPVFKWVSKYIKNRSLSAFIVSLLVIIIVAVPLVFATNALYKEANVAYADLKERITGASDTFDVDCENAGFVCRTTNSVKGLLANEVTKEYVSSGLNKAANSILEGTSKFFLSIPSRILGVFIMLFVMFFFFLDGPKILESVWKFAPVKVVQKKVIEKHIGDVTFALVYGAILMALIQGVLGGVGFVIFGIGSPVLWTVLIALAALIPFVGTGLIWLPVGLYLIAIGAMDSAWHNIGRGIGIILYGFFIIGSVDNLIRPKFVGSRAKIHPIVVLVGVIGGLNVFGFIGIILGPLVLALLVTIIKLYIKTIEK